MNRLSGRVLPLCLFAAAALRADDLAPQYLFNSYMARGDDCFRQERYAEAAEHYARAAAASPGSYAALENLGDAYAALRRFADAADQYRRALRFVEAEAGGGHPEIAGRLRDKVAVMMRRDPEARAGFGGARGAPPAGEDPVAPPRARLGDRGGVAPAEARAADDLDRGFVEGNPRAEALHASAALARLAQGDRAMAEGRYRDALAVFRALSDAFPEEPLFWERLGDAHFMLAQDADAGRAFDRALWLANLQQTRLVEKKARVLRGR